MPHRPRDLTGLAGSLVLHALLIGLIVFHGERLWSRTASAGDPTLARGATAGGGGGRRVAYITLPSIPRVESSPRFTVMAPVPPLKTAPKPPPDPVPANQVIPEPADTAAVAASGDTAGSMDSMRSPGNAEGAGSGTTAGVGGGAGAGGGTGPGGGGEGGTLRPPEPRDMAFPFDAPPKELRGVSLNVTFWVRADGRVERYLVEPEIKDRNYAKKFDEVMRAFRFTPARAPNGTHVAGTTRISFTLPGKSSS
jgi:outer membrane biosynthesis protein TonB